MYVYIYVPLTVFTRYKMAEDKNEYVIRRNGLEKLTVTGKIEGTRAKGRQRMKYLDSLGTCWPKNITLLELIKATEDRELWKHVIADVVYGRMTPWGGDVDWNAVLGE